MNAADRDIRSGIGRRRSERPQRNGDPNTRKISHSSRRDSRHVSRERSLPRGKSSGNTSTKIKDQDKPMPRRSDTQQSSIVIDREINTRRMRHSRRVGRLVHCKSTGEVLLTRSINIPPMRCPGIIQGAKNCATNQVNTEAINQVNEGIKNYWIYQYSNF